MGEGPYCPINNHYMVHKTHVMTIILHGMSNSLYFQQINSYFVQNHKKSIITKYVCLHMYYSDKTLVDLEKILY